LTIDELKLGKLLKGFVNLDKINLEVSMKWRKKAGFLADLTDSNKNCLKDFEMPLLEGLEYKGKKATELFKELKASSTITKEQHDFANFLYREYPDHSIKKMGFS
jgi:hypothetical protein